MTKKETVKTNYPPETAGRLMIDKVPLVNEEATIADVEKLLLEKTANFESITYIYILDSNKKLKGIISLKEIFRSSKSALVKDFLPAEVIKVKTHTDQERVAFLALRHHLKSIPVVDKDDHFLGVVTSEEILRILDNEAVENILRFSGVIHRGSFDDIFRISLFKSLKHRLPWLILGLGGGILAALVVSRFEKVLSQNLILVAFIPLIVYMADAIGTQMEAFVIRDLAVNPKMFFLKYLWRQFSVVALIGIIISLLLLGISFLFYNNLQISLVLGIALFFAILSSVFTGLIIPYFFGKLRFDPANASGPVATIIQDILSVLVYFMVAFWLL